jgi:hypothetical protein
VSVNWKKVKKAEVIEMFEELKATYDLTFLLAIERMRSNRIQMISGRYLYQITDHEKKVSKALLNRPGIMKMEVECKCCNGTGDYVLNQEEACFPCILGTTIGHTGKQTIVDEEERRQAMEDQQPEHVRCGDCAAPMPNGKCQPCETKIPA